MKTSEQINEIAAALAKAQGLFTNLDKNKTVKVRMKSGGEYIFSYATFDECIAMVRPHLAACGLALSQGIEVTEKGLVVIDTRLLHSSGQWLQTELVLVPESDTPQHIGSASSYGRRYAVSAMLGLASEDDDDSNVASGNRAEILRGEPSKPSPRPAAKPKAEPAKPAMPTPMTPEQIAFNEWAAPLVKNGTLQKDEIKRRLAEANNDYPLVFADLQRELAELEPPKV